MPEITDPVESGRTLIYDGLAQNDLDMANHRLINLDTSNLPPIGIPPSFISPPHNWVDQWDAATQTWHASQPTFGDMPENTTLTGAQQQRIEQLGRIRVGEWQANVISGQFLTTLERIRAPIDSVNLDNHRLINVADPLDPGDAVNLRFMDFMLQGLQPKESVRCAATGNVNPVTLIRPVDGVELEDGDRVLLQHQANQAQNGIYTASDGPWEFATDFDTPTEMERAYCTVREGSVNSGTSWFQSNHVTNINTSPKHFILFSSTPGASIIPGQGLTRNVNTLDVVGTPERIVTGPNNVDISPSYVGQDSITTLGIITDGTWHGEVIDPARGGTGINNGLKTITLAGNFSTAFALDFPDITLPGNLSFLLSDNTTLTLPVSGTVATLSGTETFSNKRIVKRVNSVASSARPAINVNALDCFYISSLSEDILSMSDNLTGTATDGQELIIWIKDNGDLGGQAITWGSAWTASTDLPLPTVTSLGVWLFLKFTFGGNAFLGPGKWVLTQKLDNIP